MISKEQFLELKHLKALGVPTTRIAQKIGISVPNANKWLRLGEEAFDNYIKANTPYLDQYRAFILNILKVCPQTQATNIMYRIKDQFPDFNCKKNDVLSVRQGFAGAERIRQAGEQTYVLPRGNAARIRGAGGLRTIHGRHKT